MERHRVSSRCITPYPLEQKLGRFWWQKRQTDRNNQENGQEPGLFLSEWDRQQWQMHVYIHCREKQEYTSHQEDGLSGGNRSTWYGLIRYASGHVKSCTTQHQMRHYAIVVYCFSSYVTTVPAQSFSKEMPSSCLGGEHLFFQYYFFHRVISGVLLPLWKNIWFLEETGEIRLYFSL